MAAAPNLPISDVIRNITVDDTFTPTPQGIVVNHGDTVTFYNNSGVDIVIEFQTNNPGQPVYPSMNLEVDDGDSNSFTAPNYDCAANYYIYNGTNLVGPFVIQVGAGPMYVAVTQSGTTVTYTPQTVAVPLGSILPPGLGKLEVRGPSTSLPVDWTNGNDPFNPPIQTTDGVSHPVNSSATDGGYTYWAGTNPLENPANGRVIVQG
ncbi:MAG: hypothetical protein ABSB87_02560 [Terriglobales bacterium]|jgi:hypothetical protein